MTKIRNGFSFPRRNQLSFDGTTVTLSEVFPHVVMFADRPRHVADAVSLQVFVDGWTKGGDESFRNDPPNAGFTVWADGAYQVSVMELSDPVYDGQKLSFKVKPVEGQLPKSGEQTSVFIDWCNQGNVLTASAGCFRSKHPHIGPFGLRQNYVEGRIHFFGSHDDFVLTA